MRLALTILVSLLGYSTLAFAAENCGLLWSDSLFENAMLSDSGHKILPEKRIKVLTDGLRENVQGPLDPSDEFVDTADPSRPIFYRWPDGTTEWRVWMSNSMYLTFANLNDFERGGISIVHRVRAFHSNGVEMAGPFATTPAPWDTEMYINGGEILGHGGSILLLSPDEVPTNDDNPRRNRMWAKVVREKLADGSIDERWYYQDSIFREDKPVGNAWIGPHHHRHSYGGTLLKDQYGTPVKNKNGNYIYFYDQVDQQQNNLPWRTSIFVSEMHPSMRYLVGERQLVHDGVDLKTGKPYPLTIRSSGGSLVEGFRPLLQAKYVSPGFVETNEGKIIPIDEAELSGFASPGDYVARYGFAMLYKTRGQNILSRYQMVENEAGTDINDFADDYRDSLGLTWLGRASPYYNPELHEWRILFHAVPTSQFRPGEATQGWPQSAEEWNRIHRQIIWSPIRLYKNAKGQTIFKPDLGSLPN